MIIMGKVVAAYGIRGWIKVQPYTAYPDGLLGYDTWYVGRDKTWRPLRVLEADVHGRALVARLEAVADRTAAEQYRGFLVAVPRSELPAAEAGEYYWTDLIGLKVLNLDGEALGVVDTLMETGANDVLVVKSGGEELLIPFIADVIRQVDLQNKTIRVDWRADYLK